MLMNDLLDTKLLAGLTLLVVKTSVYFILCSIGKLAILNYNIPSQRPISKAVQDTDNNGTRNMVQWVGWGGTCGEPLVMSYLGEGLP